MLLFKKSLFALPGVFITFLAFAQHTDTTKIISPAADRDSLRIKWENATRYNKFPLRPLMLPAAMIGYGIISINSHGLKEFNAEIKEDVYTEGSHRKIHIDNYLQFAPAVTVYALDAFGIKGKHNFRDKSMIYLMSNIILNTTVFTVKKYAHQLRPDGSSYTSFPSGHTAEAFASAEFLWQEYKDVSCWYGIAGYAMAAATGYLRIYNNKHWFSDVVAGAGIGIASTKIAYWLYPVIQHAFFGTKTVSTFVMPGYQNGTFAVALLHRF